MIRFLLALALIPTLFCLSPPLAVAAPQHASAALHHRPPEDGGTRGASDAAAPCPICPAIHALSLPAAGTPRFPPTAIALDTSRTGSTVEPYERPPRGSDPAEMTTAIFKHDRTG